MGAKDGQLGVVIADELQDTLYVDELFPAEETGGILKVTEEETSFKDTGIAASVALKVATTSIELSKAVSGAFLFILGFCCGREGVPLH